MNSSGSNARVSRLKILVFDDSLENQESARQLLGMNHQVTVVGTYDEAQALLKPRVDEKSMEYEHGKSLGLAKYEIIKQTGDKFIVYPDYDVVMTDLMVPASARALAGEYKRFAEQEMPLGTIIALLALRVGVKLVAVATRTGHHNHPTSAAFDIFAEYGNCQIPGVNVLCTNSCGIAFMDEKTKEVMNFSFVYSDEGKRRYPGQAGLKPCKDWTEVLKQLTNQE